jgi:hypothetical protein
LQTQLTGGPTPSAFKGLSNRRKTTDVQAPRQGRAGLDASKSMLQGTTMAMKKIGCEARNSYGNEKLPEEG